MQLVFNREELLEDHEYARPHIVQGNRLHGGFDLEGQYQPPRAKNRRVAIDNWTKALQARGGGLLDADSSLLTGPRCPNVEQFRLLIRNGIGQTFYNSLTATGKIEARGRFLTEMPIPDLRKNIVEEIDEMAIGHLGAGLMYAHGVDEGGEPEKGIGGHDVMWFIARDLAFGEVDWPKVEPPSSIARDDAGRRWMPDIDEGVEAFVAFLNQLLLIEYRAEIGFAAAQAVLRTPGLFPGRTEAAAEAAEIIEKIRTDELIHVESLRLYLGEFRSVTLRTVDGGAMAGWKLVDPYWRELIQWAVVDQPKLVASRQYEMVKTRILGHQEGQRILGEFEKLLDVEMSEVLASR